MFDLAFTSSVKAEQERQGTRDMLGHLHAFEVADRPDLALRLALEGYPAEIERLAVVTVEGFDWNCPQHITPRFTADELAGAAEGTPIRT